MSENRRSTAAAAAAESAEHTAAAAPLADSRRRAAAANRRGKSAAAAGNLPAAAADQRAAGYAPSFKDAAAIELADGIKAGAIMQRRARAAEIVATNAALDYTAAAWFLMPDDLDPETGEQLDARDVIADVRPGTAHRYAPPAPIMSADDLLRIAGERAHTAARMTSGALDADDVRQEVALRLLEKFRPPADRRAADRPPRRAADSREVRRMLCTLDRLLDRAAAPRHVDRCDLTLPTGILPRWDGIDVVQLDDSAADITSRRRKWKGYAAQTALNMARREYDRTNLNSAADWSDAGEDAPTTEQLAAAAADSAAAAVAAAVETVDQDTINAYAATAPGGPLKSAERDALTMALAGVSRAQLAAARGVDMEAVKKGAQRGRKLIAARIDAPRTLLEWMRHGRAAATDDLDRCAAHVADLRRAAAPPLDSPRAVRLSWPDRAADPAVVPYAPAYPASVTCEHPRRGIAATCPLMPSYAVLGDDNGRCREGATSHLPDTAQRAALAFLDRAAQLVPRRAAPINGTPLPVMPRSVNAQPWTAAHSAQLHRRAAAAADTAERDTRARLGDSDHTEARVQRARLTAAERAMFNAPNSETLDRFIRRMTMGA